MTGATQLNSSLLTVSVIAVLLPAAFHFAVGQQTPDSTEIPDILSVSRAVRIPFSAPVLAIITNHCAQAAIILLFSMWKCSDRIHERMLILLF